MTALRTAAQQALEALKTGGWNMTTRAIADLERALAQQDEPHPDYPCRSDGRCQYAIDHGAEGLGSCPKGKCAIAQPQPAEDRAVAQDNLRVMREMFGEQTEPVEPVAAAVVATQSDVWRGYNGQWAPPGEPIKMVQMLRDLPTGTLFYLAPPQRKPLTEEEKRALADKFLSCQPESYEVSGVFDLISAVERAHGIKE